MKTIRILLASHDAARTARLNRVFDTVDGIDVIATVNNLMGVYATAEDMAPDVALIGAELLEFAEFEMVAALFRALDIRWLPLSSRGRGNLIRGIDWESSGLFELPKSDEAEQIIAQIRSVANAPKSEVPKAKGGCADTEPANAGRTVLIGASTGGIDALSTLLASFPEKCPPTMIVQHTGHAFGPGLVRLLNRRCQAEVVAAEDLMALEAGKVCVAAGLDTHVQLAKGGFRKVQFKAGPLMSGHKPSIDCLFASAVSTAKDVVAVLLTGMGSDGAQGMLKLRRAGATTIAQDQNSSVVYGMPRVAWENGGAQVRLPLSEIAPTVLAECQKSRQDVENTT